MLIRPDRYVYDAGRTADLDKVARHALAAFALPSHAGAHPLAVAA